MENTKKELISVIIPFYNEEYYFDKCINSALSQTYSKIEILIINDGSDKIYDDKLNKIQHKYPDKVKIFTQENQGVSAARNLGIKKSNGEYIAFLDADDLWLPDKLEYQINLIKKYKIDFIHGSYSIINDHDSFVGKFISKTINYNQLIKSCDIGTSTVLVKSDLIKKHLFKNISTKEDYVCWLSIIKDTKTLFGDSKEVSIYRDRKSSLSSGIFLKFINAFKVYFLYEKKNLILSILYTINLSIFWVIKTFKISFINPQNINYKYINNIQNLNFKESFILSALNMASLSNINLFYFSRSKFIFWIDGYCAKFIINIFNKVPGRKVINDLKLNKNIKKIYLCGKESEAQLNYLKKKFNHDINFINIPYFKSLSEIIRYKTIEIDHDSLVILNIATPKQEVLATKILEHNPNKKIFILCLGGGMSMVSGEEKIVPESIENMNLEWIWRLRSNTLFRLKRLFVTGYGFFSKLFLRYFNKTKFNKID